ncbi:hypothetical protein O6H91_Y246500 [Diphasiastrum complanatum]|nr:hypothetical protein O6H91_Y246500 [Diphasiastrum complanatum]
MQHLEMMAKLKMSVHVGLALAFTLFKISSSQTFVSNSIIAPNELYAGQRIQSRNFWAGVQTDCTFGAGRLPYPGGNAILPASQVLLRGHPGIQNCHVKMQLDGNFVLYDSKDDAQEAVNDETQVAAQSYCPDPTGKNYFQIVLSEKPPNFAIFTIYCVIYELGHDPVFIASYPLPVNM